MLINCYNYGHYCILKVHSRIKNDSEIKRQKYLETNIKSSVLGFEILVLIYMSEKYINNKNVIFNFPMDLLGCNIFNKTKLFLHAKSFHVSLKCKLKIGGEGFHVYFVLIQEKN